MVKQKRENRVNAAVHLLAILSTSELTIEEITAKIYQHVNADTKGRIYEMLSILLSEETVIPMVRNKMLLWKLNLKK